MRSAIAGQGEAEQGGVRVRGGAGAIMGGWEFADQPERDLYGRGGGGWRPQKGREGNCGDGGRVCGWGFQAKPILSLVILGASPVVVVLGPAGAGVLGGGYRSGSVLFQACLWASNKIHSTEDMKCIQFASLLLCTY